MKYNSLPYDHKEEKRQVLQEMLGSIGAKVSIGHSFICDYGRNIHIGNNVTVNTGCTFVDCNRFTPLRTPLSWMSALLPWKRMKELNTFAIPTLFP